MCSNSFSVRKQKEVDDNFTAIQSLLKQRKIPNENYGKFALMQNRQIKGLYSTWEDAYQAGLLKYDDRIFSVQEITTHVVDLGYYSRAII